MTKPDERVFPARRSSLAAAAAFVEAFCARYGVAHGDVMRLTLVVEELFTNTIVHGHGGDCDAPVRIVLTTVQEQITLLFEDRAPPFDPLQAPPSAARDLGAAPEGREVGGLGVHLVVQMAHSLDYEFVDGCNRLQVLLQRER